MSSDAQEKSQRVIKSSIGLLCRSLFADSRRTESICGRWLDAPLTVGSGEPNLAPVDSLGKLFAAVTGLQFDLQIRMSHAHTFVMLFGNRPQMSINVDLLTVRERECVVTLSAFSKLCFRRASEVITELGDFLYNDVIESAINRMVLVRALCAYVLSVGVNRGRFRASQEWLEVALEGAQIPEKWKGEFAALKEEIRMQRIPLPIGQPTEVGAARSRSDYVSKLNVRWLQT